MSEFEPSPEFTGVFIPASVWLNTDINCVERCLLAEIGALGGHRGDCRAGNEFLGSHVGVSGHRASVMIAKLIGLGLVEMVSFNGRTRRLRVTYDAKADPLKTQRQTIRKRKGSLVENTLEETRDLETGKREEVAGLISPAKPPAPKAFPEEVEFWNKNEKLRKVAAMTPGRAKALASRRKDPYFVENWKTAIDKVAASSFCQGHNDRGWRADFDFFVRPDTIAKIMEGKYDDKRQAVRPMMRHDNNYNP